MSDGHGRQLKSPKSKKFRGHNRDTLACRVPNHFHPSLLHSQISLTLLPMAFSAFFNHGVSFWPAPQKTQLG